jgi:hypothetical protein
LIVGGFCPSRDFLFLAVQRLFQHANVELLTVKFSVSRQDFHTVLERNRSHYLRILWHPRFQTNEWDVINALSSLLYEMPAVCHHRLISIVPN